VHGDTVNKLAPDGGFKIIDADGRSLWSVHPEGDLYEYPKVTFSGVIDPLGKEFSPVIENPGGVGSPSMLWVNSTDGNLYLGSEIAEGKIQMPGNTGTTGPMGGPGPTGSVGPDGETGMVGEDGTSVGEDGPMGVEGPTGLQVTEGLIGKVGLTGPPGDIGPVGVSGPTGPVSMTLGAKGETGPVGNELGMAQGTETVSTQNSLPPYSAVVSFPSELNNPTILVTPRKAETTGLRHPTVYTRDVSSTEFGVVVNAKVSDEVVVGENGAIWTSLLLVGGHPAIAYFEDFMPVYARSRSISSISPGDWANITTTSPKAGVFMISLAIVGGNPAVAYPTPLESGSFQIIYSRSTDGLGDTWPAPTQVRSGQNEIKTVSLFEVEGFPAVAWTETGPTIDGRTTVLLNYRRALNVSGTAWRSTVLIDADVYDCQPGVAVVDGFPSIAYAKYDTQGPILSLAQSQDSTGQDWNTAVSVFSEIVVNSDVCIIMSITLLVVSDNPAISFMAVIDSDRKVSYIRSTDSRGTNWPADPVILDDSPNQIGIFYGNSMTTIEGVLTIAYGTVVYKTGDPIETELALLKYVRADDSDGTRWTLPVELQRGRADELGCNGGLGLVGIEGKLAISSIEASALADGDLVYDNTYSVITDIQEYSFDWIAIEENIG